MTILGKDATLNQMLQYVKEHIDSEDYDPASNTLRKIGEHMAKWLILNAGLWEEACNDRNGKKYSDPTFGRCIFLLNNNRIIDKLTYEEVFRPLQKFGNRGSHEIARVEEYEVIYAYNKTKIYVNDIFLKQFPNAVRYDVLPTVNSRRANTVVTSQENNGIIASEKSSSTKEKASLAAERLKRKKEEEASRQKAVEALPIPIIEIEELHPKRQQLNQIHPAALIGKYAAYALGVADPIDPLTAEKWNAIFSANEMSVQEKVKSWQKYGRIKAATLIAPGNGRLDHFWMITDNRTIILAPIPRKRLQGPAVFGDVWSIGSFAKTIDEFGYGHALSEEEFIAFKPNKLVIDNSITVLSFKNHCEAFYQSGYHGVTLDEHDYYCKTLHWVEKLVFDPRLLFTPFSYSFRFYEGRNDINTIEATIDIQHCDGVSLIRDGLQIESSSSEPLPYFIKNNIIYRKDNNMEVICLNEKENEHRYYASHREQIEKVKMRYRGNGLCQYCGGVFSGRYIKKCSKCGRRKDY